MVNIDKESFKEAMEVAMEGIAFDMQRELQLVAPVDTGEMRRRIGFRVENEEIVFDFIEYTKFVEFGVLPHVRVSEKGNTFRHPGQAPQPFIRNTFRRKLMKIIKKNIARQTFKVSLS